MRIYAEDKQNIFSNQLQNSFWGKKNHFINKAYIQLLEKSNKKT